MKKNKIIPVNSVDLPDDIHTKEDMWPWGEEEDDLWLDGEDNMYDFEEDDEFFD